jgi:anti-sigma factor RsiW
VRHGRARRLLPALPDQTLPALLEGEVRAHLQRCRACRCRLDELETSEALLRLLPVSLVPRRSSSAAESRLAALARWSAAPAPLDWSAILRIPALGVLAAAATVGVLLSLGSWEDGVKEPQNQVLYAALYPGPASTPYTWR